MIIPLQHWTEQWEGAHTFFFLLFHSQYVALCSHNENEYPLNNQLNSKEVLLAEILLWRSPPDASNSMRTVGGQPSSGLSRDVRVGSVNQMCCSESKPKNSKVAFIWSENLVSHSLKVIQVAFYRLHVRFQEPFYWGETSTCPLWHQICDLLNLSHSSFLIPSLTESLLFRLPSWVRRPALGRVLLVLNFFDTTLSLTSWFGFCSAVLRQLWDLINNPVLMTTSSQGEETSRRWSRKIDDPLN